MSLETMMTIENGADTEEEFFSAVQSAINLGETWKFQGSVGRTMMRAIENGDCMLGIKGVHDYWGNYVPARTEVQDGTKGSRGFVVERRGEEWAAMLEAVV